MDTLPEDLSLSAVRLNDYFAARLGPVSPGAGLAGAGLELVEAVLAVQRQAPHLLEDGVLGPKTRAHLRAFDPSGDAAAPLAQAALGTKSGPNQVGSLIVDGVHKPTPFATTTFDRPEGLSFLQLPNWQLRERPRGDGVDLVVLHWDECISSTHCFEVLWRRGLSVHLMLDADGMVYQALDLAQARAWHARTHNERSVGIEIQNDLVARAPQHPEHHRLWLDEPLPHSLAPSRHTDFTIAQKQVIAPLVTWLCQTLGIDSKLPEDASQKVLTGLCPQPFAGVCGHYHLQTDKVDPGLALWPELQGALRRNRAVA